MRNLYFVVMLIGFTLLLKSSKAQSKKDLLQYYFLTIPVTDSFTIVHNTLASSPYFGVDSVRANHGLYSSLKKENLLPAYPGQRVIFLLQHQVWQDSITKTFFDTAYILSAEYLFPINSKKDRDAFYKKIRNAFSSLYAYVHDYWFTGPNKGERRLFINEKYDNFAELTIYKGYVKDQFYYVTIRYNNRRFYRTDEPSIIGLPFF